MQTLNRRSRPTAPSAAGLLGTCAAVLVLAACSVVPEPQSAGAYRAEPGPYAIDTVEFELEFPALDKALPLRIVFPESDNRHPIIVFSHGGFCPKDMYLQLAEHWASYGYIVALPVHGDSVSLGFSMAGRDPMAMMQLIDHRRADMAHVLDSLDAIEAKLPASGGRIDRDTLIAAGHSMGGGTAMSMVGVRLSMGGRIDAFEEDRFDMLLLIGDPGNRPDMPEAPWRAVAVPTLVVTGSDDIGGQRGGPPAQMEFAEGTVFPNTPHHYLYINDMNHYMGGLICRSDAPGPPDPDAVVITRGVSVAFLDAYTKDDDRAQRFLDNGGLGKLREQSAGRARLEIR